MKSLFTFALCLFSAVCMVAQVCGPAPTPTPSGGTGSLVSGGGITPGAVAPTANVNSISYLHASQHGLLRHMNNAVLSGKYSTASATYKTIKGSPYLTKSSVTGTLVMNDGSTIKDVPLQYDTFAEEIVATNHEGEEIVLDTRFYKEIVMDIEGEDIYFAKVNPDHPDKFYELLYDDSGLTFYKDITTKVKEGENKGIATIKPRFRTYTHYYLKQGDDLAKVNLKKKDILSQFPQLEAIAMAEYCKKKGIKLKKEEDFIAMFQGTQ